jgi:hypothetical protein
MIHIMLPTQYLRRAESRRNEPYKRLMAAVLQTLIDDCRGGSVYRRARGYGMPIAEQAVEQATDYLASTDRTWPFSFENLCEALGLNAGSLRKELRACVPYPPAVQPARAERSRRRVG